MKKILIADDDADNRAIAALILRRAGYEIFQAEDALQGLEVARNTPLDLVLLDMSMPGLSGWEAAERFKALPGRAFTLLAYTAHAFKGDEERALAAGCDGYVAKPCTPTSLLTAVRSKLELPAAM